LLARSCSCSCSAHCSALRAARQARAVLTGT
jgi:hypothetical protein